MSKWVCSECKQSNNSHARYCMQCGQFKKENTLKKTTVTWRCPICKEENNDYEKYCRKCGHWLLSETYTPTRIEKGEQKTYSKPPKINNKVNQKKTSKITIVELILVIILGCIILIGEGSLIVAFSTLTVYIFLIHLFFSVVYIVKSFLQSGIVESGKKLLKHGGFLLGLSIVASLIINLESDNITYTQAESLYTVKSNAVELEYEDMLRNANGKYKNTYVKVSGKVYHLENGNQKKIMINMSSDPFNYQAVYVKRSEQNETVILNDNVVIYGKLTGVIGTTNVLGAESAAPVIESYSLILQNE